MIIFSKTNSSHISGFRIFILCFLGVGLLSCNDYKISKKIKVEKLHYYKLDTHAVISLCQMTEIYSVNSDLGLLNHVLEIDIQRLLPEMKKYRPTSHRIIWGYRIKPISMKLEYNILEVSAEFSNENIFWVAMISLDKNISINKILVTISES